MVTKRFFIFQLAIVLILWAGSAYAASVGVIFSADIPYYKEIHKAFTGELEKDGFSRSTIKITQTPASDAVSWANAARKMAVAGVDVIVAYGTPATLAVLKETSGIAVVFAAVPDPQALGITGKHLSGIASKVPIAGIIKDFKLIKNFGSLGIIYNNSERDTVLQAEEAVRLGTQFGYRPVKFNVTGCGDAERIKGVDALFLTSSCVAQQCLNVISSVVRRLKIPAASPVFGGEQAGIVLTVSASPVEQGEKAGELAAKALRGENPSGVESPRRIEVIVNLREARELDLKIPLDLLSSATRVIK